jgi:hypothetical protein
VFFRADQFCIAKYSIANHESRNNFNKLLSVHQDVKLPEFSRFFTPEQFDQKQNDKHYPLPVFTYSVAQWILFWCAIPYDVVHQWFTTIFEKITYYHNKNQINHVEMITKPKANENENEHQNQNQNDWDEFLE